jgi:hypothetical protein
VHLWKYRLAPFGSGGEESFQSALWAEPPRKSPASTTQPLAPLGWGAKLVPRVCHSRAPRSIQVLNAATLFFEGLSGVAFQSGHPSAQKEPAHRMHLLLQATQVVLFCGSLPAPAQSQSRQAVQSE